MKKHKFLALILSAVMCIGAFPVTAAAANKSAMTAKELVSKITVGWNLGNTLDATGGSGLSSETSWGNPKTTKAMIDTVKKAGFNTVRIPVSWGKHIDSSGKIDSAWLDRVQEVVDYAYDNGMYVILNTHHDKDWITLNESSEASVTKKFTYLWQQIAKRFSKYDQKLIFEALNEPNTEGSANQWNGGTSSERKVLNDLYDAFYNTVRSSGGNNKTRILMITPYGASAVYESMADLTIPDDDYVAVSIHAYLPYSVALDTYSSDTTLTSSGKKEIDYAFSNINKAYISKGIPVIMGEFGTLNKSNTSDRAAIAKYYLSVANKYGIPCCWWDNGITTEAQGTEGFALLNRSTLEWFYPEIVKALVSTASGGSSSSSAATSTTSTSASTSTSAPTKVKIGGKTYKTSMTGTLDLSGKGLTDKDIANLKYMTKIDELILSDNKLTSLSAISGLTNLKKLTYHNNSVKSLSFAKKLTNLTVLGAENNGITSISALSGLTKLEELWLQYNDVSSLTPIKKCTKLKSICFTSNKISDISVLANMKKLTFVGFENCRLKSISALKNCTKLEKVYLSGNKLTSLTPLANSTNISELYAANNSLNGKYAAIKGLKISEYLDLSGNGYDADENKFYDYSIKLNGDDDGFTYNI
jgi:endoglucanase